MKVFWAEKDKKKEPINNNVEPDSSSEDKPDISSGESVLDEADLEESQILEQPELSKLTKWYIIHFSKFQRRK